MRLLVWAALAALSTLAPCRASDALPYPWWFISGRVVLQDGAPPRDVKVAIFCYGSAVETATANGNGSFNMRFRAGEYSLVDCDLRASSNGYTGEAISLRDRRWSDTSPVGTLILRRTASADGRTVSATTLAAPKQAMAAYDKGREAADRGKLNQACSQFEKAVRLYPSFAAAWTQLGEIQASRGQPESAVRSFENAIRADPKYVPPYLGLAGIQASLKQWDELRATAEQTLKLNPTDYPQAYYLSAAGNYYVRNLEAAEKRAREGLARDGLNRYPQIRRILGSIEAARRNFAEAAIQFREYLRLAPNAADADDVRQSLKQVEELGTAANTP